MPRRFVHTPMKKEFHGSLLSSIDSCTNHNHISSSFVELYRAKATQGRLKNILKNWVCYSLLAYLILAESLLAYSSTFRHLCYIYNLYLFGLRQWVSYLLPRILLCPIHLICSTRLIILSLGFLIFIYVSFGHIVYPVCRCCLISDLGMYYVQVILECFFGISENSKLVIGVGITIKQIPKT